MDMEGGMDIILSTAELSKQSYSTVLVAKLRRYDKTTPWIKGGWSQVIQDSKSSCLWFKVCWLLTSGTPQWLILVPAMFNMLSNNLDNGIEYTIVRFAGDINWGQCLLCGRAELPCRGVSETWWNGLSEIWSLTEAHVKPHIWDGAAPCWIQTGCCWAREQIIRTCMVWCTTIGTQISNALVV